MQTELTPRQARSRRTQEQLLDALERLLAERVFEKITIQDIAAEAGVAVGTVYRRFRNKEALLPSLYRRLDRKLEAWGATVWRGHRRNAGLDDGGLARTVRRLVTAHVRFYRAEAPLLRTLYLQVRLDGELADPAVASRRRALYETLLTPVWACVEQAGGLPPRPAQARCFILLLLTPLTERYLFPDNTPASTLALSDRQFIDEMTTALAGYLRPNEG